MKWYQIDFNVFMLTIIVIAITLAISVVTHSLIEDSIMTEAGLQECISGNQILWQKECK